MKRYVHFNFFTKFFDSNNLNTHIILLSYHQLRGMLRNYFFFERISWGGRIRTYECRLQKPVPYRKAHEEWWSAWVYFFRILKTGCASVSYVCRKAYFANLELLLLEIKLYQMSFRYCFFLSLIYFLYNEVTYKHL